MDHRDILGGIFSPGGFLADHEICSTRREFLAAPLLAALSLALSDEAARAGTINPSEKEVTLPGAIKWGGWIAGSPPHSGEMAALYGGLNKPGPYLVLMKWYPGYMSAPHTYATDRLSLVLSGTWWVNSGTDFDPDNAVPVPAGGFVRRTARTPHYDGVRKDANEPTVIGLFGIAPHLDEVLRRNGSNATVVDRVLERLTRFLEQRGCAGLARRKLHAGKIGRVVHALNQDRPTAVIDHGDDASQMNARGLRLGGRNHLPRSIHHFLFCKLRRGIPRGQR